MGSVQTPGADACLLCRAEEAGGGTQSSGSVEVKPGAGSTSLGPGHTVDKTAGKACADSPGAGAAAAGPPTPT